MSAANPVRPKNVAVLTPPAQAAGGSGKRPTRVTVLGSRAAGKTCFLAGLEILAEPDRPSGFSVTANGPSQIKLREHAAALRNGEWPPGTIQTIEYDLTIIHNQQPTRLTLIDYPGDDFMAGLEALEGPEQHRIKEAIKQADILLLMLDATADVMGRELDDKGRLGRPVNRQEKLDRLKAQIDALNRLRDQSGQVPEVAIVLTKVDLINEDERPTDSRTALKFLKKHQAAVVKRLREFVGQITVFPLSAVGKVEPIQDEQGAIRLRPSVNLTPKGYEALFDWINEYEFRKNHPIYYRLKKTGTWTLVGVLAVGIGIVCVVLIFILSVLNSKEKSPKQKLIDLNKPLVRSLPLDDQKKPLVEDQIGTIRQSLGQARSLEDVEIAAKAIEELKGLSGGVLQVPIRDLEIEAKRKREDILFNQVKNARDRVAAEKGTDRMESAVNDFNQEWRNYLREYPQGTYLSEVRSFQTEVLNDQRAVDRARIRNRRVSEPYQLIEKAKLIDDYVDRWEKSMSVQTRDDLRRAAALARKCAEPQVYTVTIQETGTLTKAQRHWIVFQIGDEVIRLDSGQTSTNVVWDQPQGIAKLKWRFGQKINFWLSTDGSPFPSSSTIGGIGRGTPGWAILDLVGRTNLLIEAKWQNSVKDNRLFIKMSVDDLTERDHSIAKWYLAPGDQW